MENKKVFNDIISDYAIARPGYPTELFRDIIDYSKIKNDAKILEIGSGPGQATEYFVKNRYSITGLELGEKQVDYLLEKYSAYQNFNALCTSFENYNGEQETYDLIISATAFHWIKPEVGYPKAYNLLKRNGVMAVFWHLASIIEPKTEMLNQIRNIYRKYAPDLDDYISVDEAEDLHNLRISQIQVHHLFNNPVSKIYRWDDEYTTQRYIRLMNSYSDFHDIDKDKQKAIFDSAADYIDSNGGKIVVPQEVRLYMAKK
ncbi:class I SAM-dependent methyltransferase [Paenibacillus sp. BSR1-1]|uniref:class I SAM-dependent methyltransferase n=1 Tax=Paenibacillus sp. BSR1-1 TaxID=3020845 RepID=UPI0025B2612D|nr:class I SAM-dependent methyltransferase [Paenibacillus sp. BSR1-1]MDN3019074.1 class I SAM-dependent methyltransferase [Paenibacillus sp. BSR1-1]